MFISNIMMLLTIYGANKEELSASMDDVWKLCLLSDFDVWGSKSSSVDG